MERATTAVVGKECVYIWSLNEVQSINLHKEFLITETHKLTKPISLP